jgi:CheY-like chemotaxis protein
MDEQHAFVSLVKDALHHLYDYERLENHPLTLRLLPQVSPGGPSRAQQMNRLLLETIEALHPPSPSSPDASRARFYTILTLRFVDEKPLPDILRALGFSRSQFFREQHKAITMLAHLLETKLSPPVSTPNQHTELLNAEAERVLTERESVDAVEIVQGIFQVIGGLARQHNVVLEFVPSPHLPPLYGSRTLLRQVFLETLSHLITRPGTQRVRLRMSHQGSSVAIQLTAAPGMPSDVTSGSMPDLEPVRRLVKMVGGQWQGVEIRTDGCTCRFNFPTDKQKVLLVVDDNEGIIRAFRGYLADYNYQVIGATTGTEALRLARELRPAAITLDVMMPTQDGWEILHALKTDPATQHIPVIICSVLEDPALARALGASTYLGKPVTESDLLTALQNLPNT